MLVAELLDAYDEAKRNYYLGGLRLAEVEGGRFCEAAYRMLEQELDSGKFTRFGKTVDTLKLSQRLESTPPAKYVDAIRLHIPRALRVVYDVRNNRDAAHLGDGIDPNTQDATFVVGVLDWVLAELIRLHHNVPADEAQKIVEQLVERRAPVVEDFDGFLKVLKPDLAASDHCLVLLYQSGRTGATFDELSTWARPGMRRNLRRTLSRLVHERALVHDDGERFYLTQSGINTVDDAGLIEP
jgi:hypothetical protein